MKARLVPLSLWLTAMLACLLVIVQTRFVADLSAFLPRTPNARQQLLIDQLRDGAIARLIMIGIEGSDATERARLSVGLAQELSKTKLFVAVQNGQDEAQQQDRAYFFNNRYLLSPAVTADHYSATGLRAAISETLEALSGSAGMSLKPLLAHDPTGETLHLLDQFSGLSQPQSVDGVWSSRDGKRALLLAFTRAAGSDTEAQSLAVETVRARFHALAGGGSDARLVMSGAGVSSAASRATIEHEVSRLAGASFVLVACLLLAVYRSPLLLGLGLLPVLSGVAAGIAAVSLVFGQVHGLTLAFGTTLIGEAVDYSVYFFIQRSANTVTGNFWRTIWLGVLTSIVGFAALLSSSFPGLAQLGLYSISGLITAVLVTRYVLPVLTPTRLVLRDMRQLSRGLDWAIGRAHVLRWAVVLLALGACTTLVVHRDTLWNSQLSSLNPVPKSEQQVDEALRADLGGTDARYFLALSAPDQEQALQLAERAGRVLQSLVRAQVIAGFSSPATVLPSVASQLARQSSLPDAQHAHLRLVQALQDLPLRVERLDGFIADMQSARERAPLQRKDLEGTSAALMLDSMLIARPTGYLVLMPLRPLGNTIVLDSVETALQSQDVKDAVVIDLLEETGSLFDGYRHEALWLSGLGCLLVVALLLLALRSGPRTLRVLVPLACSVLCVSAALLLSGTQLTILNLIGLLLVVAVGSNYALFFDPGAQSGNAEDRRQMQVSLLVANLTSVGSFGLLGLSKVPVLAAIGSTVAPGAFLALVFAAILTHEPVDATLP